jgi:predicted RecA/RadA family phage recombinase
MALEVLREVLESDYRGPKAVFSEVHVMKSIMAIGAAKSVGRGRLGVILNLGQGEVRTLIRRMKEKDLIVVGSDGCKLTARGEREFRKLTQLLAWSSEVQGRALKMGECCWAILARGAAGRLRFGIEQRDAAVRAGANGALTAVFKSGVFKLPKEETDCEKAGPRELWSAVRKAGPKENDVIVVSGADGLAEAEFGALAAAITLI